MEREATIRGEGFALTLRLTHYEFPEEQSGDDANWVVGTVEVSERGLGQFTGTVPVTVRTEELAGFHQELEELHSKGHGTAELEHMEDQLGLKIELSGADAELSGFVKEPIHASLAFTEITIPRPNLLDAVKDFEALAAEFPVRSRAGAFWRKA